LSYPGRSDDRVVCHNWLLTCQRVDSDGISTARCATQLDHQAYRGSSTDRACSPSNPVDRACDQGWFQYVHHGLTDRNSVGAFVLTWPSSDVCPGSVLVGWLDSQQRIMQRAGDNVSRTTRPGATRLMRQRACGRIGCSELRSN
jgi:hypothetical protein